MRIGGILMKKLLFLLFILNSPLCARRFGGGAIAGGTIGGFAAGALLGHVLTKRSERKHNSCQSCQDNPYYGTRGYYY